MPPSMTNSSISTWMKRPGGPRARVVRSAWVTCDGPTCSMRCEPGSATRRRSARSHCSSAPLTTRTTCCERAASLPEKGKKMGRTSSSLRLMSSIRTTRRPRRDVRWSSCPPVASPEDRAEAWFRRRTSHWQDWPVDQLMSWKRGQGIRISVVIPARDEEATVGSVVAAIRDTFMTAEPLVDELVMMDSDSTDRTAEAAAGAGATVYRCRDVGQGLGAYPGKGEALWKSLLVTTGDILLFVDADLTRWGTHFVTGLLGPLLDPAQETLLVKACYDRARDGAVGGGRVTELVARPLLNLWWPELAGVAQPLAGEWAARRSRV